MSLYKLVVTIPGESLPYTVRVTKRAYRSYDVGVDAHPPPLPSGTVLYQGPRCWEAYSAGWHRVGDDGRLGGGIVREVFPTLQEAVQWWLWDAQRRCAFCGAAPMGAHAAGCWNAYARPIT